MDVGCNAGTFALPLARRAERVVCIDADAQLVALLQRSLAANGITNVRTLHAAVTAAQSDMVSFHVATTLKDLSSRDAKMLYGRDSFITRTVPAVRLDSIVQTHGAIDLLKIDIEGFSGDAIASLGNAIDRVRFIIAEPSPDMAAAVHLLERAGMTVRQPLASRSDLQDHVRFTYIADR